MLVFLRSVLHADEKRLSVHVGIPSEMITLTRCRAQNDVCCVEVPAKFLFELGRPIRIRRATRLRAVKGCRTVAFPIIDVAAAHASGVRRFHHDASRPPMMFCSTPLKTPAAAASGIVAKCSRASEAAMPPFCMPTSMLTVRATDSG